jgi:hypothetical protein
VLVDALAPRPSRSLVQRVHEPMHQRPLADSGDKVGGDGWAVAVVKCRRL